MKKEIIYVVIPALNEEETIGRVIDEIPKADLEGQGYEVYVLVVDNNSSDCTKQIAEVRGARVISEPRRGKGKAIRTALACVKADYVFMIDADYTYPATHIPEMLHLLKQGYQVVIGSRLRGRREKGAIRRLNMIGNILLTMMANVLYQRRISDLCTGCWGFRGEVTPGLKLRADGFQIEADLFSQVAMKGYRIGEIPIYYRSRPTEAKLNRIRDGIMIAKTLVANRFSWR